MKDYRTFVRWASAIVACIGLMAVLAGSAGATTDLYASNYWLADYNYGLIDNVPHKLTGSYVHELNVPNGWICAGDSADIAFTCNPNEAFQSYGGLRLLNALAWSHIHGGTHINAHADY